MQEWDLVDNVSFDGERAGVNAAKCVARDLKQRTAVITIERGENIRSVTPHRIVAGDDVECAIRVQRPLGRAELRIGELKKKLKAASPSEVIKVRLKPEDIEKYWKAGTIQVSCTKRQGKESDDD